MTSETHFVIIISLGPKIHIRVLQRAEELNGIGDSRPHPTLHHLCYKHKTENLTKNYHSKTLRGANLLLHISNGQGIHGVGHDRLGFLYAQHASIWRHMQAVKRKKNGEKKKRKS